MQQQSMSLSSLRPGKYRAVEAEELSPGQNFLSQFGKPWNDLLSLIKRADTLEPSRLVHELGSLQLDDTLVLALIEAVKGDNHLINDWLFSRPADYSGPIAWLAPVTLEGSTRFAWMIGHQSTLTPDLRQRFAAAASAATEDPLLQQCLVPSPLLFVHPVEVSVFGGRDQRKDTNQDEFAIFQTNYRADKPELSDFEQRMVVNADYLVNYRQRVLARARLLSGFKEVLDSVSENISLLALIHTEGHNRGHFLGPWPLEDEKKVTLYQALEEYRACVAGIRLAEHLGLNSQQLDVLAISVLVVRFLGYGFDAYCSPNLQRRTAREITIGLMFFETLLASGAIELVTLDPVRLKIDPVAIRQTLIGTLRQIHEVEAQAVSDGKCVEPLRELARQWYRKAFPHANYSPAAQSIHNTLLLHKGEMS